MSKYSALGTYLRDDGKALISLTFSQLEQIIPTKLPASKKYPAWWSNSPTNNVMTQIWLDAGYRTEQVDVVHGKLVFRKVAEPSGNPPDVPPAAAAPPWGLAEAARALGGATVERHPAFGALKGMLTIEPGYDVTKPVYT